MGGRLVSRGVHNDKVREFSNYDFVHRKTPTVQHPSKPAHAAELLRLTALRLPIGTRRQ